MSRRRRRQLLQAQFCRRDTGKASRRKRRRSGAARSALALAVAAIGPSVVTSNAYAGVARSALLVSDVKPGPDGGFNPGAPMLAIGHDLYFSADDGVHGEELWRRNTDTGVTAMVADIETRPYVGGPDALVAVGPEVFFTASDPDHGRELWRSNGTAVGTVLVKDVVTGDVGAYPDNLTVSGDSVYFTVQTGNHNTTQLWKSDGTGSGTVLVKNVNPTAEFAYLTELTVAGDTLFFTVDDGSHGRELWKSDGTTAGTALVEDIMTGPDSSWPAGLVADGGRVFFTAQDGTTEAGTGRGVDGLWASDGTSAGTLKLADLPDPGAYQVPSEPVVFENSVFITSGHELWRSDGTVAGTSAVGPTGTGPASSPQLHVASGAMYFAGGGTSLQKSLWKTDGTVGGTLKVATIPYSGYGDLFDFTAISGAVYFRVWGADGRELWSSDGTSTGTGLVVDMNPGVYKPYGDPSGLTLVGDTIYFAANRVDVGRELFLLADPAPVDTTPPDTTITSGPADGAILNTSTVTFGLSGTVGDTARFQCSLDGDSFADCISPVTFSDLSAGTHSVRFRAIDASGNIDPTPAQRTFVVEPAPPPTSTPNPTPAPTPTPTVPPVVDNGFVLPKRGKSNFAKATMALTITLPGPGRLELSQVGGDFLRARSETVAKGGETVMVLGLTKPTLRKLKKSLARGAKVAKVKVRARVTYTPVGGDPSTQERSYVLKLK